MFKIGPTPLCNNYSYQMSSHKNILRALSQFSLYLYKIF